MLNTKGVKYIATSRLVKMVKKLKNPMVISPKVVTLVFQY